MYAILDLNYNELNANPELKKSIVRNVYYDEYDEDQDLETMNMDAVNKEFDTYMRNDFDIDKELFFEQDIEILNKEMSSNDLNVKLILKGSDSDMKFFEKDYWLLQCEGCILKILKDNDVDNAVAAYYSK